MVKLNFNFISCLLVLIIFFVVLCWLEEGDVAMFCHV